MTDEKWRSPNGHSIASDVTDKLPPKGEAQDDVQNALNKWDNQGEINHEELCLFIEYTRRALAQQQTVGEYLTQSKCGIHNKYNAFRKTDFGTVQVFCPDCEYLAQQTVNEWQPIETAPKNDYIVVTDGGFIAQAFWSGRGWMMGFCEGNINVKVDLQPTHWMPLPEPPRAEQKGGE